jgi:TonB-linked SusC/RagA family outer membrane protein
MISFLTAHRKLTGRGYDMKIRYDSMNLRKAISIKALFFCLGFILLGQLSAVGQVNPVTASLLDKSKDGKEHLVSVHFENEPLPDVLHKLARKVNVGISYDTQTVPDKRITYAANDQSIYTVLGAALQGTGLQATLSESRKVIVIKEKPALQLIKAQVEVEGAVIDGETGEPLPGVNISVEGTTTGTTTNVDGEFSLKVPGSESVLVFSFIGYKTQKITVGDQSVIEVVLEQDLGRLDEVIVVGYGTQERRDLTGSVDRIEKETFQNQNITQIGDMLAGTIAGFSANQSPDPAGGSSMEVRGPTSITAGTDPMIVLDGAVFNGSLRDINPNDIETIDILKDASSAAIYGAKAASGVVLITTNKGEEGKPTINYSSRVGVTKPTKERRPLGPDEYIQFRSDWFRTVFPSQNYHYYTHPEKLPNDVNREEWRNFSESPLENDTREYLRRLAFFPIEQENYIEGKTTDWYDVVMRNGVRQKHDISVSGGSERATYYWSIGYTDNEGLRVGEEYSTVRSRLNVDFEVVDWLNVGLNAQFSDRDEGGVPASMFYANSPFGQVYDEQGNLERLAHGHTNNPLLEHKLRDRDRRVNSFFSKVYADVSLPFGIEYNLSFQPRYEVMRHLEFRSTDVRFGGDPDQDQSLGFRDRYSQYEWMVDNLLKWNKQVGVHGFEVTLLYTVEEFNELTEHMLNRNFAPNEELGYHGLQFGDNPEIDTYDTKTSSDGMMARLNYTLMDKYLLTASIRRDGYSAFGQDEPRAIFPAAALAWQISEEEFFDVDEINQLKLRLSWGINGNRDIGPYAALSQLGSNLWYDGSSTQVGVYNSSLANPGLVWERTESFNVGLDVELLESRISLTMDAYDATTTDLLMNRRLPTLTGFDNVTTNLGKLSNRGLELTLRTNNISSSEVNWSSELVFSLNRNEIGSLYGDQGEYTLLGETRNGELPDFTNQWFIGRGIDAVWDYDNVEVWQEDEADQAAEYGLRPGDFKAFDVNGDGNYRAEDDKRFIGHEQPRYRLGLRNEVSFLGNWTASMFIRADLGHIGAYSGALNPGEESNDRRNRHVGPIPYWTPENPSNEYARLDLRTGPYGGGLMVYKPRSFVRIQDLSVSYSLPSALAERLPLQSMRVFGSVRNLATFTKWPHWDPESGGTPMPSTYTIGINLSL